MARKLNPGAIKTGSGRPSPKPSDDLVLTGGGMAGAGPNIGQAGYIVPPNGTLQTARKGRPALPFIGGQGGLGASLEGLTGHVKDPKGAHPAVAISIDGHPDLIYSDHVEGAIDELMGAIPPEPPQLGIQFAFMSGFSAIPDWGCLKLNDSNLKTRGFITSGTNPETYINRETDVYPYWYTVPSPTLDVEFTLQGADPITDMLWNVTASPGGGRGICYTGGFTRSGGELMRTTRLMTRTATEDEITGLPQRKEVTISGAVFPADRGVLALIHWPAGGSATAFQAQPLLERCVAALLLGQGIIGDKCFKFADAPEHVCDGQAGGIFAVGVNGDGNYDPFAFPGRATGQYDLKEICIGEDIIDAETLKPPWDDYYGDGNPGWQRVRDSLLPGPGQVRLGTVPEANDAGDNAPVFEFGIPVLGGTPSLYASNPPDTINGQVSIGSSLILNDNFFRYRLPYLDDYSKATGLKYTPSGVDKGITRESERFFVPATPNSGDTSKITDSRLNQAGDFGNFTQDYWVWQIARYRHVFALPSVAITGSPDDIGTYMLMHFKRERDFEAFVRDAVMPNDANNGYALYGAYVVSNNPELDRYLTNEVTSTASPPPAGPAPDFGYAENTYHPIRSTLLMDPDSPVLADADFPTKTVQWASTSTAGDEHVVWVSGVAYFLPTDPNTGDLAFTLPDLSITGQDFWKNSFRTSDDALSWGGAALEAPAKLSAPCPAVISLWPFSYGLDSTGLVTYTVENGFTDGARFERAGRIEVPYTHCGTNGGGPFSESNGPLDGDDLTLTLDSSGIDLVGDDETPSFSSDAKVRAFFRRPLGHNTISETIVPWTAAGGHGIILDDQVSGRVLYHSTSLATGNRKFGNFVDGNGDALPTLSNVFKDTHERFLDEVYRYTSFFDKDFLDGAGGLTTPQFKNLLGPGMQGWSSGPIEVPVRAGDTDVWGYREGSWIQSGNYKVNLAGLTVPADLPLGNTAPLNAETMLQVAGLPDRNPPLTDWVVVPFPSAGLLKYPNEDYTGDRPSAANSEIASPQPDYSALTGRRSFLRAFDAGFGDASNPVLDAQGSQFVTLRFDGIELRDFAWTAGSELGSLATTGMALLLKLPGLTTWLDLGRRDGDGPSKQDERYDGAGCLVLGPDTKDGVDPTTGMVFCQVKAHVGPAAALFTSTSDPDIPGAVPVLVKVLMDPAAADYNLKWEALSQVGNFRQTDEPGLPTGKIRGLTGIRIVRTDGKTTLEPIPQGFMVG